MKEMILTRGFVALVDDEDYESLSKWKWSADKVGYAYRMAYDPATRKQRYQSMHRQILGLSPDDRRFVDHIDLNKSNNRRANLRIANRSQNGTNRLTLPNNTSGVKGVSYFKETGQWKAYVHVKKKLKYLGLYDTIEEAAEVRQLAAAMVYGEFANHGERT